MIILEILFPNSSCKIATVTDTVAIAMFVHVSSVGHLVAVELQFATTESWIIS